MKIGVFILQYISVILPYRIRKAEDLIYGNCD